MNIVSENMKVKTWEELKEIRDKAKAEGKTFVFTNGCFDILHVGHLRYLQEAKKLGHIFVVAVNSDSSVKELKGPSRPVNFEQDRMELLAGLECVDYVTMFTEKTAINVVNYFKPDIYVKGGDIKMGKFAEYDTIMAYGGKVEIISMDITKSRDYSTTNTIKKSKE